jgi:hypothetical protein
LIHQTALHNAAWNGHDEAVKVLLEFGADKTIQDVRDGEVVWESSHGRRDREYFF